MGRMMGRWRPAGVADKMSLSLSPSVREIAGIGGKLWAIHNRNSAQRPQAENCIARSLAALSWGG